MRLSITFLKLIILFTTLGLGSCKKWDDRTEVNNPLLKNNLLEEISRRANLSKFNEYLVKTGLDKEISSSKIYTVWAPVNEALQGLDPATVNDSAKLRHFISNHISSQSFYTSNAQPGLRVPLLNNKRASFVNRKFDESTITEADITVGNGVLHILDKAVAPLPNAWEWVNSSTALYQQNKFVASQNFKAFDPSNAIIDSIRAGTGQPVYRPGTDSVTRNRFNDQVFDLTNEDKVYTYFVLNDAALQKEIDSLNVFYKTGTSDSTYNLAAMSVVKDAIVEGMYTPDQLPASLVSKFGVIIPIDKNAIVETRRLSNGVAYVLNKLDFTTRQKIPNIILQGENPAGFFRPTGEVVDVRTTTFFRLRTNPLTGQRFNDIFLYNHGISGLNILYRANSLASATYKVFWVAVNDTIRVSTTINPVAFSQRLAMGSRTATNFAARSVAPNVFTEIELGEYTHSSYGALDMFLTAASSTTAGANTLTLDYIRLEPQF